MRWLPVLALTLVVTACGTPAPSAAPTASPSAESPAPSAESPAPSAESPSGSGTPAPTEEPPSCSEEAATGIEQTIRGQQAAFALGDFAEARRFSSKTFQASVSEEQFALIIDESYSFLLDDPPVEILACAQRGDLAQVIVRVSSSPEVGMSYRLVLEEPGWRIDGATVVAEPETVAA